MKDNLGTIAIIGAIGAVAWYWYSKQPTQAAYVPTKNNTEPPSRDSTPDYGFSIDYGRQFQIPGVVR